MMPARPAGCFSLTLLQRIFHEHVPNGSRYWCFR